MEKTPLSQWFEKKFLEWQLELGRRASLDEFAEKLQISRGYLSQILNGDRVSVGMKSAIKIAEIMSDPTLLDILGYARPDSGQVSIDSLPAELREQLRDALLEIEETLKTRSIQPDSPEGVEVSVSVLKKFGFNIISIEPE